METGYSEGTASLLKIAWKEPTPELRARYFANKKKVVMQLLVFRLKPMTAEKKAQGLVGDEYEKARICLQGQNHEGFQVQNSTTNADAHLPRLFLAVQANPKHVLASFDVSNAFLNAEPSEDVITLTQLNVSMQFVPTAHQKADILTRGLTAYAHELARQGLRLQICDGL